MNHLSDKLWLELLKTWYISYFPFQILAGANVNELTPQKQTPLHLAALHDRGSMVIVLVENNIDYDALDNGLNNGKSFITE